MPLDALGALDLAVDEFRSQLAGVDTEQWTAATPCTDWDVRFLVAHVVGGNRFASMVLGGQLADEALDVVMGTPQLGDHPLADFDESATRQRDAFHGANALERTVSHPLGELSGERFLTMRVFDITLHAWDLATSIGRATTVDDTLVEYVLQTVMTEAPGMGFGIVPCGDAGADATPLEQLLDLSGRCTDHALT